MTSAPESGWVFRSDATTDPAPAAAPPRAVATPPPAFVVTLPPPGPLRFVWMPLAIAYSTILAMLPQRGARR